MIIEITTEIIWGTFLDVKHWPGIKNPKKYEGQRVVIGSATDGYNPQEKEFGNTRKLLEQIRTIDKQRVIRYFGKIDRSMMRKVESGILVSLGIYRHERKGESIGTDHDFNG